MTLLPIVERELRVRARHGSTYHGRWVAVAVASLLGIPMLLSQGPGGGPNDGKMMFNWLTFLALAYCLFGGARQTADCLSSERREGTLGLLFLTDLRGYDVVLGKLVANSLSSFYYLVAMMPVLGLALLAGGVTGGEFWRVALVLVTTLFFSLAIGMWISSRSTDERKVLPGAFLLIVFFTGGLPLVGLLAGAGKMGTVGEVLSLFSPGYACYNAFDTAYRANPNTFWYSLLLLQMLGWLFLASAAHFVTKFRQEEVVSGSFWGRLKPAPSHETPRERASWIANVARANAKRQQLLDLNPVIWLARRTSGKVRWIWLLAGISVLMMGITLLFQIAIRRSGPTGVSFYMSAHSYSAMLVHFALYYYISLWVCRFFMEARRSGSFELLLCTPIRDQQLLRGLWLSFQQTILPPLVCLWLAGCAQHILIRLIFAGAATGANRTALTSQIIAITVLNTASFVLHYLALVWVGLWFSLSDKKPGQAPVKTFVFVTLLPWLACSGFLWYTVRPFRWFLSVPWFSHTMIVLIVYLAWIRWARPKVQMGVRRHFLSLPGRFFLEPVAR